jgi:hypothetical protein
LKFFAILKPMPHLGQLTVDGFFVTSTKAPQKKGQKIPPLAKGVRGICQIAINPPVSPFFKGDTGGAALRLMRKSTTFGLDPLWQIRTDNGATPFRKMLWLLFV